ncbi:MAG: hypothetical protein IT385_30000 [Deltaproteobacteria bacterium]|nr:hypothetical protein [Deltaproteobacteria bacterium]
MRTRRLEWRPGKITKTRSTTMGAFVVATAISGSAAAEPPAHRYDLRHQADQPIGADLTKVLKLASDRGVNEPMIRKLRSAETDHNMILDREEVSTIPPDSEWSPATYAVMNAVRKSVGLEPMRADLRRATFAQGSALGFEYWEAAVEKLKVYTLEGSDWRLQADHGVGAVAASIGDTNIFGGKFSAGAFGSFRLSDDSLSFDVGGTIQIDGAIGLSDTKLGVSAWGRARGGFKLSMGVVLDEFEIRLAVARLPLLAGGAIDVRGGFVTAESREWQITIDLSEAMGLSDDEVDEIRSAEPGGITLIDCPRGGQVIRQSEVVGACPLEITYDPRVVERLLVHHEDFEPEYVTVGPGSAPLTRVPMTRK